MTGLFPAIVNDHLYDGALVATPSQCYTCHLKGCAGCCKSKRVSVVQKCRYGVSFYRKTFSGKCYLGVDQTSTVLNEQDLAAISLHDVTIAEIAQSFAHLRTSSQQYDDTIKRLRQALTPWIKRSDYSLPHGTMIDTSPDSVEVVRKLVENLRKLTTGSNELVNAPDPSGIAVPEVITKIVEASSTEGFHLSRLQHYIAYKATVESYQHGITAFDEWVHDVGHYMVRLDAVLPASGQHQINVDAVRSLDALTTELILLKIELMEHLGLKAGEIKLHTGKKSRWYEPYKVFHKHRYCYTDGTIVWTKGDSEFRRKAKTVAGVDFLAMNLYSNAVKYVRRFPGEKTVKTSFIAHANGVEICVESYGPIVTESELNLLGTKSGIRALSAAPYRGMGRGLLRVRNVCQNAGYKVWFSSDRRSICSPNFALFGAHIFIPEDCFMDTRPQR